MTEIPEHELRLMDQHVGEGTTVLEFGNKKNPTGAYREWYESRGAIYTCVDINGRDGAHALDVRQPFYLGQFDVVTNWGFSEHVSIQAPFWANAYNALNVGGLFIGTTPQPRHWLHHGWSYWHPADSFYWIWASLNNMDVESIKDVGPGPEDKRMWGYRLRRVEQGRHLWDEELLRPHLWRNENWAIPADDTVFYGRT